MKFVTQFIDLFLGGFEAAQKQASKDVVARYSRGNVCVQNGNLFDDEEREALLQAGDRAWKNAKRLATH